MKGKGAPHMRLRIMTFNTQHCLNYIERKIDFKLMADTVKRFDPDIVGLNEMRGSGTDPEYTDQVGTLMSLTGLNGFFGASIILNEGPYGNGFLTRFGIEEAEVVPIPQPSPNPENRYYENRAVIKARLSCGLTLLVTHFGLRQIEAENAVKTVLPLIGEKTVLMGDFNVTPDNPVLKPIREKLADAAALCGNLPTYPSDKPEIKIDYIFATPDIKITSAEIPSLIASDHLPHIAEIEF